MPSITPSQHKAIDALLMASDIKSAAKLAGIAYSTLRGWLANDTAFCSAYSEARRLATEHALAVVQSHARLAVGVLVEIMTDADAPAGHRVNAAARLLDMATRTIERDEVERRLAELERQLVALE